MATYKIIELVRFLKEFKDAIVYGKIKFSTRKCCIINKKYTIRIDQMKIQHGDCVIDLQENGNSFTSFGIILRKILKEIYYKRGSKKKHIKKIDDMILRLAKRYSKYLDEHILPQMEEIVLPAKIEYDFKWLCI